MCIANHSSGLAKLKRSKAALQTKWLVLEFMDPDLELEDIPVSIGKDGVVKRRKKAKYVHVKVEKASAFDELRLPFVTRISFVQLAPKDCPEDAEGLGPLQAYLASSLRTVGNVLVFFGMFVSGSFHQQPRHP